MSLDQAQSALATLAEVLETHIELAESLRARWLPDPGAGGYEALPPEASRAANLLAATLPPLTESDADLAALGKLFAEPTGGMLLSWCRASTWRRDTKLAPLLECAASLPVLQDRAVAAARDRVIQGPLIDALECAPLLGDGLQLKLPVNVGGACAARDPHLGSGRIARARLRARASGSEGSADTFEVMIREPAHGTLRGRVLSARCLEVRASGGCCRRWQGPGASSGGSLQVLQPLLLHPEPMVWVHAARALGRLTGALEQLEGTLLDWVLGDSRVLRQRGHDGARLAASSSA